MLSLSPDELIKLSKTSYPQKLFDYDRIILYAVQDTSKPIYVEAKLSW